MLRHGLSISRHVLEVCDTFLHTPSPWVVIFRERKVVMESKILNGTGHNLILEIYNGRTICIPPDMDKVICKYSHSECILVDGLPVTQRILNKHNLPAYREGVYIVVSKVVKSFFPHRDDLLLVGSTKKTEEGIVALGLQRF